MFISKCHTKRSIGNSTQKADIPCTRGQIKMNPIKNKCMIYFIINVDTCIVKNIQCNTNKALSSADSRANIGRMTADIRRLSADSSLIKCHRPTVWRSSADWRPPSADIMMKKNFNKTADCRPSPDASPTTKPMKIGGWVNEPFNLGVLTKNRRPTKNFQKSVPTSTDNWPTSPDFPIFGPPTVGLGNVTAVHV